MQPSAGTARRASASDVRFKAREALLVREPPEDAAAALREVVPGGRDRLAVLRERAAVVPQDGGCWVLSAKKDETRERRLEELIAPLGGGTPAPAAHALSEAEAVDASRPRPGGANWVASGLPASSRAASSRFSPVAGVSLHGRRSGVRVQLTQASRIPCCIPAAIRLGASSTGSRPKAPRPRPGRPRCGKNVWLPMIRPAATYGPFVPGFCCSRRTIISPSACIRSSSRSRSEDSQYSPSSSIERPSNRGRSVLKSSTVATWVSGPANCQVPRRFAPAAAIRSGGRPLRRARSDPLREGPGEERPLTLMPSSSSARVASRHHRSRKKNHWYGRKRSSRATRSPARATPSRNRSRVIR
jgi:hypothetical protein